MILKWRDHITILLQMGLLLIIPRRASATSQDAYYVSARGRSLPRTSSYIHNFCSASSALPVNTPPSRISWYSYNRRATPFSVEKHAPICSRRCGKRRVQLYPTRQKLLLL